MHEISDMVNDAVKAALTALLTEAPDKAAEVVWAYIHATDASFGRKAYDESVTDEEVLAVAKFAAKASA